MKIYTCTSFVGHYPVGTAAVVRANSKEEAAHLLEIALTAHSLPQKVAPEQMEELPKLGVVILADGNY